MAGKAMVYGCQSLRYAVDALSKNALADILVDRVLAEDENATESQIAAKLQEWANPVLRMRGDMPVNLAGLMLRWLKQSEKYLARLNQGDMTPEMKAHAERLRAEIEAFRHQAED